MARRKRLKQFLYDFKAARPCSDCNKFYDPLYMSFDHVGPKSRALAHMAHNTASIETMLEEIKNTEVVCVLCHRTRLRNRRGGETRYYKYGRRNQELVESLKNVPCAICGEMYKHWQMDFDHIERSSKVKPVSVMAMAGYAMKTLLAEIAKCQVICVLCHRKKSVAEMREDTLDVA
jgi:hypothetical protein